MSFLDAEGIKYQREVYFPSSVQATVRDVPIELLCRHKREIVPHLKIDKYQHSGSHLYEVYEESPPAIYVDIKYVFGNYKTLCLYRDYDVKSIYKVNIFTLARQ